MINELKKNPATYPYPHKFVVQITVPEFIAKYESLCKEG
jgi:lysyl-tRNA synthetase class 2